MSNQYGWKENGKFGRVEDTCTRCERRKAKQDGLCRKCLKEMKRISILELMEQGHG